MLLAGCRQTGHHNKDLEESIYEIVADTSHHIIALDALTTFTWEKAYLFTPYSTQESMAEQLGIKNFKDPSDLDYRDDIYLLVFVQDDQVIQYVEIERQGEDFSIGEHPYLTPKNPEIHIQRNEK